jgi:uncharacterized protein YjiS (DUF1127 family)
MEIKRVGAQPSGKGTADHFMGSVRIGPARPLADEFSLGGDAFVQTGVTGHEEGKHPLPPPRRASFTRLVEALRVRLQTALARRAATDDLAAMSERELADMGINRHDADRLFDPEFAHEYTSRRGSSARYRTCSGPFGRR